MRLNNKIKEMSTKIAYRRIAHLKNNHPIVTFTFDDFPISAFENGSKILNEYNVKGTYYICMSYLDNHNSRNRFTKDSLVQLIDDGHELACHTFDHLDADKNTDAEFELSIKANQRTLNEILNIDYRMENFSYPYGRTNPRIKRQTLKYFKTARGTSWGSNFGKTDLNLLNACKLYGEKDYDNSIKKLISKNSKINGWLIFYTHDVQSNPSEFGCTAEVFKSTIELALKSGAQLMSVREAFQKISYLDEQII